MKYSFLKLVLAGSMVLSPCLMAGCSNSSSTGSESSAVKTEYADAQALLEAVWNATKEDKRPAVVGGMGNNVTEGMPMAISLDEPDTIAAGLNVPADLVEQSEDASVMMNAMMANAFTASAWQLKDSASAQTLVDLIKTTLSDTHWLCTMPEVYSIVEYGNEIIVVYGYSDQVKPFIDALRSVCPDAKITDGVFE
ncbi:hypothetical protein [Allobaculum mucilyticum]|uniref:hypothetical protein n=1 Tax=Allobaculum mucilyticum TaxID=2834459 RepID=UPI001E3BF579|nr:hypothetical protein [Allobaculum mucilyticum]UNT95964.1 hypothetical protein KWG62_11845 [Allobaculum mucilyticum]